MKPTTLPTFVLMTGLLMFAAATAAADDLGGLLIAGEDWQNVAEGFGFTEGPAVDLDGRLYFTDTFGSKILRLSDAGKSEPFVGKSYATNGLMFGPDGRLYGCQNGKKQIVAYDSSGTADVIATDVPSNDLVITASGGIYFTDPPDKQVWYIAPGGEKRVVDEGLEYPNGLVLLPDGQTLVVAEMRGVNLWAYRVEPDGSLKFKQPFYTLRIPEGKDDSGADGLTVDTAGRVYATSYLGLQVFDPEGRLIGIIERPQSAWLANAVFAGPELDTLYVTSMNRVFKRKINARGFRTFDVPAAR